MPSQQQLLPVAAGVNRDEQQMVIMLPQFADEALEHLVVDPFEHPGVVGIEEPNSLSPLFGEGAGPQVGAIAEIVGDLANARRSLGAILAIALRIAAQDAGDGRAGNASLTGDVVNSRWHDRTGTGSVWKSVANQFA